MSSAPHKPRISAREAIKAERAKLKKCELDQWVQVPQNEAALVLVVGSAGVGLAHIDSDSVGHAKKLAQYALGTINEPTLVCLASPTIKSEGDSTTKTIRDEIREVFPGAILAESDSLGWDFEKNCMVNTFEIPARECRITDGVSRWKLSTFTDGHNPFQR